MNQTVEQINNSTADDGRVVPAENGNAGENGSVAESREDARREWEEMIASPKFHALYTEHVSEIVKKRLRSERESTSLLDAAAKALGVAPALVPARVAELVTPVQRDWQSEESAVREKYPEFDLQRAQSDPSFATLLQSFAQSSAVSLTSLYELSHLESLTAAAAKKAAEQTASQMMGTVQLRHARPHENGLQSTVRDAGRASRLTRAQRAVLAERAAKGEQITF